MAAKKKTTKKRGGTSGTFPIPEGMFRELEQAIESFIEYEESTAGPLGDWASKLRLCFASVRARLEYLEREYLEKRCR